MIERLAQSLSAVSFGRGLALGALVGAAIAGSTIWSRLREARSTTVDAPVPPPGRVAAPREPQDEPGNNSPG